MQSKSLVTLRAGLADRLLWFAVLSPIFISFLIFLTAPHPDVKALIVCFIMFTFPQIWLTGFRIELANETLSYRELFRWRRSIVLAEVTKAKVKVGVDKREAPGTPRAMFRLMLHDAGRYKRIPFVINIKPFHQDDLATVANAIVRYALNAKLDKTITALANRDVRAIAREGTGKFLKMAVTIFIVFLILGLLGAVFRILS